MAAVRILQTLTVALCLAAAPAFSQDDKVARGKYLVDEIARCADCHTPKLQDGSFMKTATLRGTTLNFAAAVPVPGWKTASPDITPQGALWKRWGGDGLVKFLQTGKGPRGNKPGPPMPAYNLRADDAEAIVAYLKTLTQ